MKNNNFEASPWINKNDFLKNGAVFIDYGCDNRTKHYQDLGFNVTAKQCFSAKQTNKFKPGEIPFTLYLIGPTKDPKTSQIKK